MAGSGSSYDDTVDEGGVTMRAVSASTEAEKLENTGCRWDPVLAVDPTGHRGFVTYAQIEANFMFHVEV